MIGVTSRVTSPEYRRKSVEKLGLFTVERMKIRVKFVGFRGTPLGVARSKNGYEKYYLGYTLL